MDKPSAFKSSNLFLYGLIIGLLILIAVLLSKVERLQRLKALIWRNLLEEADDEGFDEILFRDLNPDQSVEIHRRQRFEAAAGVLGNATREKTNERPPPRRRGTYN
ncbi:uncharacterized protein LOC108045844 [Drosophila rhopaloa]|uniref:Uncharacterized protein LOC108045844 n=1 Tax=Drosophila rhopaloa TaxID=1041015 RepID=A0A6P4EVL3_DRORH|nr:uncharacterized protein LOC108045844 [Drosophila rhopaloa]